MLLCLSSDLVTFKDPVTDCNILPGGEIHYIVLFMCIYIIYIHIIHTHIYMTYKYDCVIYVIM